MPEINNKKHKYIESFNPDVALMSAKHQDYLCHFNAGQDYKNFNEFLINNEWESALVAKEGVTYIVFDHISPQEKKIIAFYTLSVGAIPYIDRWFIPEEERENPDILNPSRRRRIAAGSGRPVVEVNRMIKQFKQMREMMSKVTKGNMKGLSNLPGMDSPMAKMAMRRMNKNFKKNKKKRLRKVKRYHS